MTERILLIQTAFIGDAILTLPLIQEIKKKYKDHSIDVITIESNKEIFTASPFVDEVIILDKRKKQSSILALKKFADEIKKRNYALLFAPHRSFRTSLLTLFLGIPESYGFNNSAFSFIYKNVITYDHSKHEIERNLSLISNSSEITEELPILKIEDEIKSKIELFFQQFPVNKKIAAIAPGTVWETKRYPEKYLVELIDYLVKKNYSIILIGSKNEIELCNRIKSNFKLGVENNAGRFSILESIEVIKRCDLLITNDSAPTHFGMCADIPVLTIYCSTIPEFGFYPYNKKSRFITLTDLYCKPCGIHGFKKCPLNHFNCGNKLKPSEVIEKIDEMIEAYN